MRCRKASAEHGGSLSMASESILSRSTVPVVQPRRFASSSVLSDYWALTKPEVNFLIVVTTFAGFQLGAAPNSRSFILAIDQHSARYTARGERYRHPESIHRAPLRFPNAQDCPSSARGRPPQSLRSPMVWYCIIGDRHRLSGGSRQCTREPARAVAHGCLTCFSTLRSKEEHHGASWSAPFRAPCLP